MSVQHDINEALMNDILKIYSDAEDKMLKAVAKRVAKGITTEGWNETKLKDTQALKKEVEKILSDTAKLSNKKVSKGIISSYKAGVEEVDGKKGIHETIMDDVNIPMNLKMLVLSTNQLLDNASFQVLRKSNDAYQKVMAHATTGLLAGTDTRIQASQKMLNEFASKGITSFVDKAGRSWDLSSYAEMCARTVGSHAALQGHIDRQIEVGEDLVKVSTIGTTCPICQRWQGVVLSISGKHPKYHSLEVAKSAGLFHPNCKHTLTLFIPELDGEGKVEPDPYDETTYSSKRNKLIEKQRSNERNIRYWKKRKALALTSEEQKKCDDKIKAWQYKNLIHCEKNNLRRQYAREGVMSGKSDGPIGALIGGSLKEYEDVFKGVVGESPKTIFKMNLQLFAQKSYQQWLKEEIQSLDELDVDKAMMKDASNKAVTPTTLYKKYIGDNPGQDYAAVSEYEKGTKEYKSGYAKWLKEQIDEIGVSYKIKPQYTEVHEDIPVEDTKLSATVLYKKYHDGKAPTDAYKELGGEEGTGMKYGKWVETQKKELIKNGITKKVPFENSATQKKVDTFAKAVDTLNEIKDDIKQNELEKYKKELDSKVFGAYDGYLQVKEALEVLNNMDSFEDGFDIAKEKLEIAKKKHLEMVKKKAEKTYGSDAFDNDYEKLLQMWKKEPDLEMLEHIYDQILQYKSVKKEKEEAEEAAKKAAEEAKAKAEKEAKKKEAEKVDASKLKDKKKEVESIIKESGKGKNLKAIHAKYPHLSKYMVESWMKHAKQKVAGKSEGFLVENNLYNTFLEAKNEFEEWDGTSLFMTFEEVQEKYQMMQDYYDDTLLLLDEDEIKAVKELKEMEAQAELDKVSESGKVSIGREVSYEGGQLVKQRDIYQSIDFKDLENMSKQVKGNTLFAAKLRRDILGRDEFGHNHHQGHDVRLKSGLSPEDEELGKAFQTMYNDYLNKATCKEINIGCLDFDNAPRMWKEKILDMDKAIASCQISEPIQTHRFISNEVMQAMFGTLDADSLVTGGLVHSKAFMSATVQGHGLYGKTCDYMLTILTDKGTHVLPTLNYEEGEFVYPRNGKLEIVEVLDHAKKGKKMATYKDGDISYTGKEIVVRFIEEGKAQDYELPTVELIDKKLSEQTPSSQVHKHHTSTEFREWSKKISADEKKAVVNYTGSYFFTWNSILRKRKEANADDLAYIKNAQNALDKASLDKPMVLRRGMDIDGLSGILGGPTSNIQKWVDSNIDKINQGGYICKDNAFLSTSPEGGGGFQNRDVDVRIYCPAGTHAAHISSISNYSTEKETLLQSGSISRVLKLEKKNGKYVIYLELLGTD